MGDVVEKMKRLGRLTCRKIWKVGKEDKRRVIHSLKVGISLSLVSLLYLMEPLFKGIGENAIWAVMTVVVVLEFTTGATLYKGLNRGLGTLLAGLLAFLIERIANESGHIFHAAFIGTAVFLVGAVITYMRFFSHIKKNYDYGVVIFLLTFNLITVSSYRVDSVLKISHERFYTIAIGCGICLLMSLFIFPIWSGEDLHLSTVAKFDGLAKSIEVCINEYFSDDNINQQVEKVRENSMEMEDPIYKGYKDVLDSKSSDETLALYASWEPRYLRSCSWQQYVKLGTVLRHFGYTIVALHGCLQTEIKTPQSVRVLFKDLCNRLAIEVTKTLKELSDSIRNRRKYCSEIPSNHVHEALQDLIDALKSQPRLFLSTNSNTNILLALATLSTRQKSGRELKCCYKASVDGFSATEFHNRSDFKGPCVIIGYTTKAFKFGAFNPEGYRSTDDYYDTFDAFLFYWDEDDEKPIMLPKVGGSGAALFDYARGGPQFGADGLLIGPPLAPVMGGFAGPDTNSGIGDLRQAKSRLGLSYAKRPDGKESLFGDESKAVIDEVLVFCSPQIASLY